MPLEMRTDVKGVGHVLNSSRLQVPQHQRGFAWTKDEVTQLWDDLLRALRDEPEGYFIGPIVLGEPENAGGRLSVIDGQQRLATISLLFAAMASILLESHEEGRANEIVRRYLRETDADTLEHEPKLVMGETDDQYFREMIDAIAGHQPLPRPNDRRPSQALMLEAYTALRELVQTEMGPGRADWSDRVTEWRRYLHDSVEVIIISVGSDQNAYLIFETLNDRGLRLTTSDLLKNYLFAVSQERLGFVRTAWTEMSTALEGSESEDLTPTFLRHYWISAREMVRERALYRTIRAGIRTPRAAAELSEQLAESADRYAGLLNPSHPRWNPFGTSVKVNLELLQVFRVTTQRPLLMAALDQMGMDQFSRVLWAVTCWSIRLAVVGGLGSGAVEEAYGGAARRIRSGEITDVDQLRARLAHVLPADDVFRASFATRSLKNRRQARVLLAGLEAHARTEAGRTLEFQVNLDESQVNLEHVMPLSPEAGTWTNVSEEDRRVYVDRLGNQTLMIAAENKAAGSTSFDQKKPFYARSEILMTQEIAALDGWGPAQIRDRQGVMADQAIQVWTL